MSVCDRYANVTDRPQEPARLKQASFARVRYAVDNICMHLSIHEDKEQVWPRLLLRPGRIKFNGERQPSASPCCAELERSWGNTNTDCTTLVLNDGDFLHPCNHQILVSLPGTTELDLILEECIDKLA
jgi:hypothetical protein